MSEYKYSTLNERDLLDGSGATVAFNDFDTLEGINSLWDDVVGVLSKSVVEGSRSHGRSGLILECENSHDRSLRRWKCN